MRETIDSLTLVAAESEIGERLDQYVARTLANASRAEAQRLIALTVDSPDGVRVNERREKASYRLRAGDVVTIIRPAPTVSHVEAEPIPLRILFEDADLLVIDKPRGMVVHPAPGSEHGTLVNAVLAHSDDLSGIGGELRPGIVHRLDKDTGGLLMVAKNDAAHRALQAQIEARTAKRRYLAVIWGAPKFETAVIEAPVGRHWTDRKKMAVVTDPRQTSRSAITDVTVQRRFGGLFTLIEASLRTGRTHQIRVHCAYIKHPIVGDSTYGGIRKVPTSGLDTGQRNEIENAITVLGGQALHAYSLSFAHPRTGSPLTFESPLPPEMAGLLDLLNNVYVDR